MRHWKNEKKSKKMGKFSWNDMILVRKNLKFYDSMKIR